MTRDLTQRVRPERRSSAIIEIAEGFNDMMDELEETFAQIRSFADEIAATSRATAEIGKRGQESAAEKQADSLQQRLETFTIDTSQGPGQQQSAVDARRSGAATDGGDIDPS